MPNEFLAYLFLYLKFSSRDRYFICNNYFSLNVDLDSDELLLDDEKDADILKDIEAFWRDIGNIEHRLDMVR